MEYYFKPIRELPTGRGFADFVFVPKPEYKADYPALIVELKWNKNACTDLMQIKDKKYPSTILDYTGDILQIGKNYWSYSRKERISQALSRASLATSREFSICLV